MTISKLQSVPVASRRASRFAQATIVARDRLVPLGLAPPTTPVLDKLCLPQERLAIMEPGLQQLGFSYEEGKLERPEGGETRAVHFTLVRNGIRRPLLFVQDETITFYTRENRLALEEVRDLFQGNYDCLYFFHNSNPDATYKNLMEGQWSKTYRIRTRFIALSDLDAFRRWAIEEQVDYLKRVLDVPEAPLQRPAANLHMPVGDLKKVANIIAGRPEFRDEGARGRRVFVEQAGLLNFAAGFNFDGSPSVVAFSMTVALMDKGLGQLLGTMKDLGDISGDDRQFIVGLLDGYTFEG